MPDSLLPTIIQFPLLAIFVWFTFEMQKRFNQSMDESLKHASTERAHRDEQWRAFLLDQRQAQSAGMEALSARMAQMANVLASMDTSLNQVVNKLNLHDVRAEEMNKNIATLCARNDK